MRTKKPARKTERLELRVTVRHRALLEEAAALTGQPVTAFAISTLVERAMAVITEHHTLTLSQREWKRLLKVLDNPPKPNKRLVALMRGKKSPARTTSP
jgi:uncharacterized protein (DUF1778 family)